MRVSRAEMAKNRERIIETAAKLFRERGFDGIGVSDLMKAAGMTHGGFYGHFKSKDELMAQACQRALADSLAALRLAAAQGGKTALSGVASTYLSPSHRDRPGQGCVMAALASEAPRHNRAVREAFTQGVRAAIDALEPLAPGKSKRAKREHAFAIYTSMVGALVLARAVDDASLSTEVLESVLASVTRANSSQ